MSGEEGEGGEERSEWRGGGGEGVSGEEGGRRGEAGSEKWKRGEGWRESEVGKGRGRVGNMTSGEKGR